MEDLQYNSTRHAQLVGESGCWNIRAGADPCLIQEGLALNPWAVAASGRSARQRYYTPPQFHAAVSLGATGRAGRGRRPLRCGSDEKRSPFLAAGWRVPAARRVDG